MKTFYIETFGCQMNAHDSEKVIGTLVSEGYRQVPDLEQADLVLYNTCSIRDKAEQKVFHRLDQFKKAHGNGKVFAVIGMRGAAGRRAHFRTRAAREPGGRLGQLREAAADAGAAGSRRPARHRLESRYRRSFRNAVHAARQSTSRLHHHHRRLRQVLRLLRGSVHARPGAQPHQRERAERSARSGGAWDIWKSSCWGRTSTAIAIRRPPVGTSRVCCAPWAKWRASAACVSPLRTRAISSRRSWTRSTKTRCSAITSICRCSPAHPTVLERMQRLYTRDDYMRRIDWMKKARRNISITTDIIVGFPGETEAEFEQTLSLLEEVEYDSLFNFKYSRRPNTPALALDDHIPEEEKTRRLAVLQEKFSGPSRSGGIPNWSGPSRRPSWKAIIRPRGNGSEGPPKIGRSTSFIRSFQARAME